jgi:hypothetical protein
MAIGGILSAARISVVVSVGSRSRTARPQASGPDVEEPGAEPFDAASETETRTLPESRRR